MTKPIDPATAEAAVRKAASALRAAIDDARAAGLRVSWPHRPDDLDAIAISVTGKAKLAVVAQAPPAGDQPVAPETIQKATVAAQKAADKVISQAAGADTPKP